MHGTYWIFEQMPPPHFYLEVGGGVFSGAYGTKHCSEITMNKLRGKISDEIRKWRRKALPCLSPTARVDLVQSPCRGHVAICPQHLLSTSPPLVAWVQGDHYIKHLPYSRKVLRMKTILWLFAKVFWERGVLWCGISEQSAKVFFAKIAFSTYSQKFSASKVSCYIV